MTIHLQEVVRSEVDGGLAGPANLIPSESIDCGCAQLPCPKLTKFATRRLFVLLLSWVGLVQAAAYAYFYIAAPTIARRFQFDPYVMEWVVTISDLTPLILGILVAYWGDRIHRAAWIGGIVLVQSVSYFILIIPHLMQRTKVVQETESIAHLLIYSEDSQELCSEISPRIIAKENVPSYVTLGTTMIIQIIAGVANISYLTLGISYLDDNTKKKNVAAFIGVLISVKLIGVLLGCILAWICLRIDSVTLSVIESYREQIGAWWLGLPILTVLLVVPGLLLSWFPRMLPSEVVEKAAASLLKHSNRYNRPLRKLISQKVGSSNLWPSLGRLFTNKTLIYQVLACTLYITAIVNFTVFENLIAQSRFHVPKPTGILLGFEDPVSSRLITNIVKPILIGLIIIVSGLVITKAKPRARCIIGYGIVVVLLACGIILYLSAVVCNNKPIVGTTSKKSLALLQYCNRNCGCSNDADFRPVCDSKGMFTFYSPCHAGCTSSAVKNGVTTYNGCSCVEEMTGSGNMEAIDGACNSKTCQTSWILFQFGTLLSCVLVASTLVGDLLVILRLVNAQDKAISIGFWMTSVALFTNVLGKILYELMANLTCRYWGTRETTCRLHDDLMTGVYLCYMTGLLFVLSVVLKILVWLDCKDVELYSEKEQEMISGAEVWELLRNSTTLTSQQNQRSSSGNQNETSLQVEPTSQPRQKTTISQNKSPQKQEEHKQNEESPLKYGPLGPGDRRTVSKSSLGQASQTQKSAIQNPDSEDDFSSSDEEGKKNFRIISAYKPLDIDSDVESDLSSVEPRSRKRIMSKDYDPVYNHDQRSSARSSLFRREFPNPDDYKDPRFSRGTGSTDQDKHIDGSSETNSFKFSKKRHDDGVQTKGDFNEVGIPIMDPPDQNSPTKDVKSLINRYEINSEQHANGDHESVRSGESGHSEGRMISGIPLVAMAPRKPSGGQSSSGFNSLVDGKVPEDRPESRESVSPKASSKGSVGTLHTDF